MFSLVICVVMVATMFSFAPGVFAAESGEEPAEYQDNSTWARIREAQFQAAKATGNLIATAVDLGEAGNIHPARKQEVGERLANCALKQVFNKDVQAMGPVAEKFEVKDGKIIVTFANADDGLVLSKGDSNAIRNAFWVALTPITYAPILLMEPSK